MNNKILYLIIESRTLVIIENTIDNLSSYYFDPTTTKNVEMIAISNNDKEIHYNFGKRN